MLLVPSNIGFRAPLQGVSRDLELFSTSLLLLFVFLIKNSKNTYTRKAKCFCSSGVIDIKSIIQNQSKLIFSSVHSDA